MPLLVRLLLLVMCSSLLAPIAYAQPQPQRIVSLDLCMDWAAVHFAQRQQIAALSPMHLRYPIDWIRGTWPSHNGSLEHVLSQQPDLVLVGQYSAPLLRQRLQQLGVKVEILPLPTRLAEIQTYEYRLRSLMHAQPERTHPAPELHQPKSNAPRLLLLSANAIGTGRDTFEHQIIEQAGWRNYLTASGHIALDLEQLAQDPPEAILFTAPSHPALAYRFAQHPVLRKQIPAQAWLQTDYWRWQCPGPWTWDLIRQLEQWLDLQPQA